MATNGDCAKPLRDPTWHLEKYHRAKRTVSRSIYDWVTASAGLRRVRQRLYFAVDFAAMSDGKEMNRILFQIEGVNDSIVSDTSAKTIRSLQPMMRECS